MSMILYQLIECKRKDNINKFEPIIKRSLATLIPPQNRGFLIFNGGKKFHIKTL